MLAMRDLNIGLGYSDVKEIAHDVAAAAARAEFDKLNQHAITLANLRASEFLDNLLLEARKNPPQLLTGLQDVGAQAAIMEAQGAYAKTGDCDLADLLIKLIIDRLGATKRNSKQVTLDTAIEVAHRLSPEHIAVITALFLLKQICFPDAACLADIARSMTEALSPFRDDLIKVAKSDFDYLTGVGCLTGGNIGTITPGGAAMLNHPGLFSQEFSTESTPESALLIGTPLAQPHPDKEGWYRIPAGTRIEIQELIRIHGLEHLAATVETVLTSRLPSGYQANQMLKESDTELGGILTSLSQFGFDSYINTPIGTAIAYCNVRRVDECESGSPIGDFI
ncbi:LPO_1073/Vpar_1526 family protein [Streptomyces sp. NPDC054958]